MSAARARLLHAESLTNGDLASLPPALHQFAERIEASRAFVRTGANPDDDAGYDEETWQRAARLIIDAASSYWRNRQSVPPAPVVSDGPDGVVDILWKRADRQLLLTIHPDLEHVATFYGRDLETGSDVVQGEIDLDRDNEWLLVWLTK